MKYIPKFQNPTRPLRNQYGEPLEVQGYTPPPNSPNYAGTFTNPGVITQGSRNYYKEYVPESVQKGLSNVNKVLTTFAGVDVTNPNLMESIAPFAGRTKPLIGAAGRLYSQNKRAYAVNKAVQAVNKRGNIIPGARAAALTETFPFSPVTNLPKSKVVTTARKAAAPSGVVEGSMKFGRDFTGAKNVAKKAAIATGAGIAGGYGASRMNKPTSTKAPTKTSAVKPIAKPISKPIVKKAIVTAPVTKPTSKTISKPVKGKTYSGGTLSEPVIKAKPIIKPAVKPTAKPVTKSVTKPTLAPKSTGTSTGGYIIKQGDTLSALAKKNNTTVDALMKANPYIKDANKIFTGKKLNLQATPVSERPSASPITKMQPKPAPPLKRAEVVTKTGKPKTITPITSIKKHQLGGTLTLTPEKKQELFPYFAYLYSQQMNPDKYGAAKSVEEWTSLIQENEDDINAITRAAEELTDEDWSKLEAQYTDALGSEETPEVTEPMFAAKGAKLQKLKTYAQHKTTPKEKEVKKESKGGKTCACGCKMLLTKEAGGKIKSTCACNCGGKMKK